MTVYVTGAFLQALATTESPHSEAAEAALDEHDLVTSPLAYLELIDGFDRSTFDTVGLVAHLLDVVPVATDEEEQVVLKAANYYAEGFAPYEAFHAATAQTRGQSLLTPEPFDDAVGPEYIHLESV